MGAGCPLGTCRYSEPIAGSGDWAGRREWARGKQQKRAERASEKGRPTEAFSPSAPSVHALQPCPEEKAFVAPTHSHQTPLSGQRCEPWEMQQHTQQTQVSALGYGVDSEKRSEPDSCPGDPRQAP